MLLRIISIISAGPGAGQTTVTVNLARGLVRKGFRVLIGVGGYCEKLYKWLGISSQQEYHLQEILTAGFEAGIIKARGGIDLINLAGSFPDPLTQSSIAKKLAYDYLLLYPSSHQDCSLLSLISDQIIVCTDLSHPNELEELQALEKYLQDSGGKARKLNLILPNKINTKEWTHNSQQLAALADFFGWERIADPIPT